MTKRQIKEMLLEVISEMDYDFWKYFMPELSEDPEAAEQQMNTLIKIARKHINAANRTKLQR